MRVDHLTTASGMYSLVSLEPLAVLQEWWQLSGVQILEENNDSITELFISPALESMHRLVSQIASGVILDPYVGLQIASSNHTNEENSSEKPNIKKTSGLILPLSIPQSGQIDPLAAPHFDSNWGVVEVANNYGVAKLTLYYHPKEEQALRKKQLVAELSEYCRYEKCDFILDLVLYTPAGEEFSVQAFQEAQLQAIQELRSYAQLLMLQYPLDPLACATLTTEIDTPWLVSSRGLRYEEYKETVRTALEGGAKGFCLHEMSWPKPDLNTDALATAYRKNDTKALADLAKSWHDQFEKQLQTTVRDQLLELSRISQEFATN